MIGPNPVSQKCRYALRAIFELALRDSADPIKIQDIASAQTIPPRFLEVILAELKHAGFVESRRGNDGGYILATDPHSLTVGKVIDYVQGRTGKRERPSRPDGDVTGDYAFGQLWKSTTEAVSNIYNGTTFADLVEQELDRKRSYIANYAI